MKLIELQLIQEWSSESAAAAVRQCTNQNFDQYRIATDTIDYCQLL
jgi:hypothetical protein